jgi:hypothetical protein
MHVMYQQPYVQYIKIYVNADRQTYTFHFDVYPTQEARIL